MTEIATPAASRLRRPSWRDGRLLVGLLLVLVAAVLGSVVVAGADDRVPMYAANGPLVPGERLTADRLSRVDVQLGDGAARYLSATSGVPPDRYVLREVRPGELVPLSALGAADEAGLQPFTVLVDAGSAATLVVGSVVDVYVNPPAAGAKGDELAGPELALERVTVAGLPTESTRLGGASAGGRPVQVMAPTARIRDLIGQIDAGARVTVVPVAGSPVKGDS